MPPEKPNFLPRFGIRIFALIGRSLCLALTCLALLCLARPLRAQDAQPKPAEKATPSEQAPTQVQAPAQIELLETAIRFEANGDSRKEIHARVHINNELGARQFASLSFSYDRAFQKVGIPLLRITHASGGTADILPSATTDQPNPAVLDAPAYQDVRVKSVRLLGLAPGDILEYRVITTVTQHPLAPDFWLEHSFSHDGMVGQELFEISVPRSREVQLYTSPAAPAETTEESDDPSGPRISYRWRLSGESTAEHSPPAGAGNSALHEVAATEPEIVITTYESWQQLSTRLSKLFVTSTPGAPEVYAKSSTLVRTVAGPNKTRTAGPEIEAIYDFVSQKIRTVDLPLGATGFKTRPPQDVLSSGYGTPEDKFLLFAALARDVITLPHAGFVSTAIPKETAGLARPSVFDHLLTEIAIPSANWWLDLNTEVAPYGVISSQFRGKRAFVIGSGDSPWRDISSGLPFAAKQKVDIAATLSADGTLDAKVKYTMRGDNELLLRIAFHQSPRERWNEVAQLLALSDGFRGKIVAAHASDPYATKQPFVVEYEIAQPKFVDWSKKPVRIPALLPQLGLPEAPDKSAASGSSLIDLGTPLDVQTQVALQLPADTGAEAPSGTSVDRDYATFSSRYSVQAGTISAARHIHFLLRQIPAGRVADYNAFLHVVQTDQAQLFTLDHAVAAATSAQPHATPTAPAPHP